MAGNRAVNRYIAGRATSEALSSPTLVGNPGGPCPGASEMRAPGSPTPGVVVQRFEAPRHEEIERAALTAPSETGAAGLSDAEAGATYFGNWSRDMNQFFINNPVTRMLGQPGRELVFEVLNVLAMEKFGRQISPRDFGVYSPREHIDNPAGQINADLLKGARDRELRQFAAAHQASEPEDISSPAAMNSLFAVNAAGLPGYLGRSIQYVEEQLSDAADNGRTDDGLMHLGNGLHTVEDLFAHSNFVEIAVGNLYESGALHPPAALLAHRNATGAFVNTLSGTTRGGPRQGARPILTTGTFVSEDTQVSIGEAVTGFLRSFDPFAASNSGRARQTAELILSRYEALAGSGHAGEMVGGFLRNLGRGLTAQLADQARRAVAGERPAGSASLWDRTAGAVRSAAGALTASAVNVAGRLLNNGVVERMIAAAVNGFGNLPLIAVYRFSIRVRTAIDDFLAGLDRTLTVVPGYPLLREWLRERMDALRELVKAPIRAAFAFAGELISRAFSESKTEKTNLAAQIRNAVHDRVRNPEALRRLRAAHPEEQVAMLTSPHFAREAGLDPDIAAHLAELLGEPAEALARLRDPRWCSRTGIDAEQREHLVNMLSVPSWVREGPSHSQIAKDHEDSPFFGSAATLAAAADKRVRDCLIAVWGAEGSQDQRDPVLAASYGAELSPDLRRRLPPAGTPEDAMTPDQRLAVREAAKTSPHFKEAESRRRGEALLREGGAPEGEHAGALNALAGAMRAAAIGVRAVPTDLRALAVQLDTAAPRQADELRHMASRVPAGIDHIADEVAGLSSTDEAEALARRLRRLAEESHGIVEGLQDVLRSAAARVGEQDAHARRLADTLRTAATAVDGPLRTLAAAIDRAATEVVGRVEDRQADREQQRGMARVAPVETQEWDPALAASHGRAAAGTSMSPERQALFDAIREIFAHPYDVAWWRPPLLGWAARNQGRLDAYITARNSGEVHVTM